MAQNIFSQLAQQTLSTATAPAGGGAAGDDDPTSAITAVAQEHGVNPNFLLGLAQLETRGGKATVKSQGVDSRNLFNIKDFSKAGTGIRALDKAEGSNDRYRQYGSHNESVIDFVDLLSRKYPSALTAQTPEEFAAALKRGGYATDPDHDKKVIATIRSIEAKGGTPAPAPAQPWDQGARYVPMEHMVPGGPPARNPNKNPDFLRGAGDVGLSFLQGAAGSVKSLTDLAGAGNAVSRVLDDTSKELGKLKSEEAQQSLAYHQQKIKDAETNGDWKQEIAAYADMVWDMPADSLAQALGSLITLGVGKAAQAVKLASSARKAGMTKEAFLKTAQGVEAAKKASNLGAGVNLGLGVGQGVGGVKGEQYERTYNAAKEEGLADDKAKALATEAQSYGKGWMQQAAGAALGYAAAKTGPLEKLASGQTVGAGGVLRRLAGGAGIESLTEGGQGAQARYAGNAAAIDAGVLDESQRFAGVAGTAFSEGLLGGVVGGGAGALGHPDVDPLATTKEAAKKPNSPISRAAVAGQPAEQNSEESAADPFFKGMSDETLLLIQRHLQARQAAGDEDIDDDDTEMAQAAKAEYERRMAAKPPPPPGLGYNPDPLIVFPDGTAGRKGDMERYVASLPEEKRNEARAKLYGYAPQPANSPPPAAPAQPAGVSASEEVQPATAKAQPAITVDLNPAPRAPSPFDAVPLEQDPAITQQQREDAAKVRERHRKNMAALRLGVYNNNPMMEFLGRHGLQPETQNEFAPGTTERRKASVYGYGPVFRQNGKPLDLLLSNAKDEGFLPPEASESDLYDLVARAINGERVEPLYKAGSADALMQRLAAEREAKEAASYEDFLAQQQALAADPDYDPFATFADTENDYDVSDLDNSGYSQAEKSLQAEVSALAQAYSQLGFDADDVLEPLAIQYESNPDEYYAQARQRLTQLIAQAAQPRGDGNLPQDSGEQTQAPIGREAANATSADDDALIDYAAEDDGEPDYFLQAQTARQLREREDAIAEQASLNAERQRALEAKAQADDERKRIEQASVRAADTFELGQNALDNLTGQADLLAQSPAVQPPAQPYTSFEAKEALLQRIPELVSKDGALNESGRALLYSKWDGMSAQWQDKLQQLVQADKDSSEANDKWVREEYRKAERRRLESDRIIQQANGKPFKKETNAQAKLDEFDLGETHAIQKVDGGFALLRKSAMPRESYTDARNAVLAEMGIAGETEDGEIDATEDQWEEVDRRVNERLGNIKPKPPAQPQDGDILSDNGKPFAFEYGAKLRAKKDGGEVVQVEGGYVVRPTQGEAKQADPVAGDKIDDEWTAFSEQSGTLGTPRAEMPQVKAQDRGAMVNFLKARGIDSSNEVMPARAIKPTQAEFSPAKVQEAANRQDGNRSIIVSADGYVVDGHHQWMAQRQNGEPVNVIKLDQPIGQVLEALKGMPSAQPEQAATQPEAQDAIRTNEGTTTPAGLPKGVPATFNNPSDVPPQPGVYRMRDGTFARFDHGIWWRSQPTAKEALLTEFSGEDQMSPESRYSPELAWAPYATISGRDAFGEASAMRRISAKPAEEISPDQLRAAGVRWEAMDAAQRKDVARASGLSDTVKPKAPQQVWSNFTPEMQQHLYRSMSEKAQSQPDTSNRADSGGQVGMNGYFYKGGQFLPNTMAEPGKWKLDGKWVTGGREETAPNQFGYTPTPFSRSIYSMVRGWSIMQNGKLALRDGIRENDGSTPVTLNTEVRPGVRGVLGKESLTVAELIDAWNSGQRWFDVRPDAETITTQTEPQAQQPTQPTIDTSPAAKWRNNWGEAKRTAESLGLPVKDGKRNLKLTEMVPAIEAKLAEQQTAMPEAAPVEQGIKAPAAYINIRTGQPHELTDWQLNAIDNFRKSEASGSGKVDSIFELDGNTYLVAERNGEKKVVLLPGAGRKFTPASNALLGFGFDSRRNPVVTQQQYEANQAANAKLQASAPATPPDTPLARAEAELADWKARRNLPANAGNVADVDKEINRLEQTVVALKQVEQGKPTTNPLMQAAQDSGKLVMATVGDKKPVNKLDAAAAAPKADSLDLDAMFDEVLAEEVAKDAVGNVQSTSRPDPLDYTPKQYADAWFKWVAQDTGTPLAEVRHYYGSEAGLKDVEQQWVDAVLKAANDGQVLPVKTIDKLLEVRPNARIPEGATPSGYQRPEARKAEKEEAAARKPIQRTAGQAAKSAATNTAAALANAIDGLGALFGGNGKLGSGLSFDEQTYAKAKPLFQAAVANLGDAGKDLKEAMRAVVRMVLDKFGAQTAQNMKPYVVQFVRDMENATTTQPQGEQGNAGTAIYEDGARPLGAVAAQDGAGAAGTGSTELRGPDGQQEGGAAGGGADDGRVSKARGRGDRPARADSAAPRAGVGTKQAKRQEKLAREAEQAPELHLDASQQIEAASPINTPALDFVIDDSLELGKGSETVKFRDNLEAIRTLKKIEAENRRASPDEQRILARYVGWGGLKNAFRVAGSKDGEGVAKGWEARVAEVEELLTPAELRAARNSTTAAHYTSETVVKGVWKAVQRLGFRGGSVLEPSMGSGNFLGLMPQAVRGTSRVLGVEYDSLTARMAQQLYPNATVLHSGYQELPMPTNQFALAIGNPPFGKESLYFRSNPAVTGMSIHNQFFVASLDALAPDGIMGMVVSRYLMDSQNNAARLAMAERAEFLGAIRLPDTAFQENARTEVVTDILFFRKRSAGEAELAEKAIERIKKDAIVDLVALDDKAVADEMRRIAAWTTSEKVTNFANSGEDIGVNRYFMRNPGMVVGRMDASGTMQARAGLNVKLDDPSTLPDRLDAAIQLLPEFPPKNTVQERTAKSFEVMATSLRLAVRRAEPGGITLTPEGQLKLVVDMDGGEEMGKSVLSEVVLDETTPYNSDYMLTPQGKWQRQTDKVGPDGKPVKVVNKFGKTTNRNEKEVVVFERTADIPVKDQWGAERIAMVRAMLPIRDLMKNQLMLESTDAPPGMMRVNRKRLNDAYDAFVKAHGPLHGTKSQNVAMTMPDGALALAAERAQYDGKKMVGYTKADILQRRVVEPPKPVESVESIADAVAVSLGETGTIDIDRIAKLMGTDAGGAEQLLSEGDSPRAFFDPELQRWESADSYLSGLVRRKLLAAQAAGLDGNVRALEKVQPQDWDASQITPNLGSAWIPSAVYADFLRHLGYSKSSVSYLALTNSFTVSTGGKSSPQWAVASSSLEASEIAERTMNSKPVKVTYLDEDKKERVDEEATAEAQMKAREIFNEFQDWAYADASRREQLVRIFNEKYNTRVTRQRDGSHLKLPGKVPDTVIKMRRHQMNAIWRGITDRSVLYDHVVGAGKTFTAIARIMERRRMGLSRKPMVVVPNHLVEQWANDVLKLYPGANVLAAGKADFEKSNRRRLFARIASGDYDMVIMGHSSFGFISLDPSTEERYLDDELRAAVAAVKEAEEVAREEGYSGFRKPFGVAEAERLVKRITERMDKLRDGKRDRLLTFEEMGVDDLTIDESHEFKNLAYSSRLSNVAGMGNKTGSSKATDLHLKIRSLNDRAGTSVAFLTGTPISNSVSEMFLILKNLTPKELKEMGMDNFDAWRTLYASVGTAYEPTESGSLKEVTRLGREWTNMRSLMDLYYSVSDAVTMDDIKAAYAEENSGSKFPIPEVRSAVEGNGDREMVVIKPTPEQRVLLRDVVSGFNGLPFIQDPKDRNKERLRLMDRARKVSLDVRAVDPRAQVEDPTAGKIGAVVKNVARIYRQWDADRGTQIVFLDRSVPSAKGDDKKVKDYDALVQRRTQAINDGNDAEASRIEDELEKFNASEIEELRNAMAGGWNAYAEIKRQLVAQGVPEDEIRFVQEANTDDQKMALFGLVKSGKVRVLIGSTPRMGAGTNVQDRLVALHHVDVTWKPSDIEQREGRIVRQGNLFATPTIDGKPNPMYRPGFAVDVMAYATEMTVDAKMWSLNATKLKAINGVRKYDGAFNMEFEDEESASMAEMAALATGNPLMIERVVLDGDIKKLEMAQRSFNRRIGAMRDRLSKAVSAINNNPQAIADSRAFAQEVQYGQDRAMERILERSITVQGKTYRSKQSAQEAMQAEIAAIRGDNEKARFSIEVDGENLTSMDAINNAINDAFGHPEMDVQVDGVTHANTYNAGKAIFEKTKGLGDTYTIDGIVVNGVAVEIDVQPFSREYVAEFVALDRNGKEMASYRNYIKGPLSAQLARNGLEDLKERLNPEAHIQHAKYLSDKMDKAKAEVGELERLAAETFPQAEELQAKRARLNEVVSVLSAQSEASRREAKNDDAPVENGFERQVRYSRNARTAAGLPTAQVEAVVRQLQSGWNNAPTVVVVQDLQDPRVPQAVRDENARQVAAGAEGAPEGFIHDETVYLVANQMGSPADATRVLLHEVLGHHGLRGVFGDALSPILRDLASKRRREVVTMAIRQGLKPDSVADNASVADIYQAMTPAQREQAAEEVLAYMAQNQPELGFVQRAVAAIRKWLKSTFPTLGERLALTDSDIVANYILPARAFVESGRPRVQAHRTAKAQSNLMDVLAALDESGVVDINC